MRRLALVLALLAAACGPMGDAGAPPTTVPPPITGPPTSQTPSTAITPTVPTAIDYTVGDCDTPPVPFALLCDVYALVQEHHVDAPLDPAALAAGAAVGIDNHQPEPDGTAPPPSFECAVPHEAFVSTCDVVAEDLAGGSYPVEEAVGDAVAAMIELSLDPFTYYLPPELSGALTEDGIVAAVGMLLTIVDEAGSVCTVAAARCEVEVTLAVEDGPAARAGVEAGDLVRSVAGEPVEGLALVDIAALLDGASGTTVDMTVEDRGGDVTDVELTRQDLSVPTLEVEVPRPGVGYLRIPDFEADVPTFVHGALEELTAAGVSEIVVDLRDNPGGLVDAATVVASEFLPDGLVLRSTGPAEVLEYPVLPGGSATSGVDLTVVVNGGSASAAEILAGVLQERGRAVLVGTPTFGKNTVQIGFPLRNEGQLRVTIARWTTPDGETVAVTGLEPDLVLDIPADASASQIVDLVLE
jgi:carboxyl-terminal processing protease